MRGVKILVRNALTACHTHGGIAPGGDVSALLVGTYGFPQVDEYVIQSSSAIVFLAKQPRLVWARNVVKQFGVLSSKPYSPGT